MPRPTKFRILRYVVLIFLALVFSVVLFFQQIGNFLARHFIIPTIEQRFQCSIEIEHISIRPTLIQLRGISFRKQWEKNVNIPVIHFENATLTWDLWNMWKGDLALRTLTLQGAHFTFQDPSFGKEKLKTWIEQLSKLFHQHRGPSSRRFSIANPSTLVLNEIQIDISTWMGELHVGSFSMMLSKEKSGFLQLNQGELRMANKPPIFWEQASLALPKIADLSSLQDRLTLNLSGASTIPWKHLNLTGIHGQISIKPTDPRRIYLQFKGSYDGLSQELWEADGWSDLDLQSANVMIHAKEFHLLSLAPILHKFPWAMNHDASVEAQISISHQKEETQMEGSLFLKHLSIFHPWLSKEALFPIELEIKGKARLEKGTHFVLSQGSIRSGGVTMDIDMESSVKEKPSIPVMKEAKPNTSWRDRLLSMSFHVQIPNIPCQTLFRAIPSALIPKLSEFELGGTFFTDLSVRVDMEALRNRPMPSKHAQTFDPVVLLGKVSMDRCFVKKAPFDMSGERLKHPFELSIETAPNEWKDIWVGQNHAGFTPYAQISPHLIHAILTTEDSTFMRHKGFIVSEFRSALQKNLAYGSFRFGASSITMQMVKNVLLAKEKTLSRKLQELFLTWYIEQDQKLSKTRILEIYFNVIEFGPGIFGIGNAARHYFGKHPRDLTARESAFFSSILPSPKKRYAIFCKGAPSERWEKYLDRILTHMHERKRLTDEEFQQALAERWEFSRAEFESGPKCFEKIKQFQAYTPEKAPEKDQATEEPFPDLS